MSIINIFIAIIVAIGFWKSSSKELDRKTVNATLTKTAILCLLSAWTVYFYYKSYQVATFKNYIRVEGHKGYFEERIDSFEFRGETYSLSHLYSKDIVEEIDIASRFSKRSIDYSDPISAVFDADTKSGFRASCYLSNIKGESTKIYPKVDTLQVIKDKPGIKHLFDISLYSNTIPSIFPRTLYEEYYTEAFAATSLPDNNTASVSSSKSRLSNSKQKIGFGYDKRLLSRFITYEDENYSEIMHLKSELFSSTFNTLNFFSGADLSQCIYEVVINSDIPVETLGMYFDIPIEVGSLSIDRNKVGTRHFVINDLQRKDGKVQDFRYYHIKFPTLANLQLVRSLILTTIMTALLSLTAANIYYFGRKRYKRYTRKHTISMSNKKRMVLLWIPLGKIIVWTLFVVFAYLLIKSCNHDYYTINLWAEKFIYIQIIIAFVIYVVLLRIILSALYKKGIYLRDIVNKSKDFIKTVIGKRPFHKLGTGFRKNLAKMFRKKRAE